MGVNHCSVLLREGPMALTPLKHYVLYCLQALQTKTKPNPNKTKQNKKKYKNKNETKQNKNAAMSALQFNSLTAMHLELYIIIDNFL